MQMTPDILHDLTKLEGLNLLTDSICVNDDRELIASSPSEYLPPIPLTIYESTIKIFWKFDLM